MASGSESVNLKRKYSDILVDPDNNKPIEDSKKPKIELDADKKFKCINAIVDMYNGLINKIVGQEVKESEKDQEVLEEASVSAVKKAKKNAFKNELLSNITVGNHLMSVIFTQHNISRQRVKGVDTNMIKKTKETSFKINYKGGAYLITNEEAGELWSAVVKAHSLVYNDFDIGDKENWYGTMGPYLDMFSAFSLRVDELRLGHNNMPITKTNGIHKSFPVSKYGLSGAHHVLLEGTSFPPERRSSIVQSIGPMTAWLGMVRSDGIYRKKYASAVKRAMAHVPCIDEIIELTKTIKQASEISALTTLIAEILLVTTSRQATRMFFPITIFVQVWASQTDKKKFCNYFSSTGAGGWYTYKKASESNLQFTINGEMETEKASQIVFHGIFGTFKEDLSILSQITKVKTWYTREQLGSCFRQQSTSGKVSKIILPPMVLYAKMACANQTGLLSGVYNQVAVAPCFSGQRLTKFDESFFEHIEKRKITASSGKTLPQILNVLTTTLEELHATTRLDNGTLKMGTTKWREMGGLTLEEHGPESNTVLIGTSKMFLGRS